jgi:deoxyribodipyrimidine photo-lyase
MKMKTVIHWFRRDLRLTDNTALRAAAKDARQVVPAYIQSEWHGAHRWTGAHRQEFLCGCLRTLNENLKAIGSRLFVRRGEAVNELEKLLVATKAEAIYFNRDPDPFGRSVEERLARRGRELGIEVRGFKDVCIHEREEVLTGSGGPFRVFTPYSNAWLKLAKPEPAGRLRALVTPDLPANGKLPVLADWNLQPCGQIVVPGEQAAQERFARFLKRPIDRYSETRNHPSQDGTSRLSQDLRHGLLSIREVFARCMAKTAELPALERRSVHAFINELIWREFYMQVLWHFPKVLEEEFNPKFRGMRWPGGGEDFARWRDGATGFPIVDAAMRELAQTGFMHNRARMIVAMFLTKDLLVDWRMGESWFMQRLTDGEIASNNGGWQWSAGTGADAAPYFRIQNPWTQSARYDPEGKYIKQWLPELRDVPAERLMRSPAAEPLARNYPLPMINHSVARERALEHFKKSQAD